MSAVCPQLAFSIFACLGDSLGRHCSNWGEGASRRGERVFLEIKEINADVEEDARSLDIGEFAVLIVADHQGVPCDPRHLGELESNGLLLEPTFFVHDQEVLAAEVDDLNHIASDGLVDRVESVGDFDIGDGAFVRIDENGFDVFHRSVLSLVGLGLASNYAYIAIDLQYSQLLSALFSIYIFDLFCFFDWIYFCIVLHINLGIFKFKMCVAESSQFLQEDPCCLVRIVWKPEVLLVNDCQSFVHQPMGSQMALIRVHLHAFNDVQSSFSTKIVAGAIDRISLVVCVVNSDLVDANWGQSTDIVYQFCRQSTHAGVIMPSHGRYVGASSKPMTEYRKQPGDRLGFNWMIPNVAGKRAIRHVIYDTNFWKSFIHTRLAMELGDKGGLTLYGRIPGVHQLLAEHLTAEYKIKTQGRGRTVDEWKIKPDRTDNHWLDCVAGCAVCASMLGAAIPETLPVKTARKPMIRLSDRRIGERPQPTAGGKMKLSDIRRSKNG